MRAAPTVFEASAAAPTVSVIIPAWNVEHYVRECLDSVLAQTIGLEHLEVLAIDDGSTDGTGATLDEYAAGHPQIHVFHEPNSGGPGRPRNVGLAHARGTYVFFLDADDYLGPEALARLVGMAERNEADIVIPRMVGIEDRRMRPTPVALDADVEHVPVELVFGWTNALKLFRRAFLEQSGTRFGEGVPGGEDGDVMARTYLSAGIISNVGSYPCYYARGRDGSQTRRQDRVDDLADYIGRAERERIGAVIERMPSGPARDRLLREQLKHVASLLGRRWRALEPEARRRVFAAGARTARRWSRPDLVGTLPAWARIRLHCLAHGLLAELEDIVATPTDVAFGDPVIEGRRVFARWPHRRDGSGIPDACFDISAELVPQVRVEHATLVRGALEIDGEAFLRLVGGTAIIELRRWPIGPHWAHPALAVATPDLRTPARDYPLAGFTSAIDLAHAAGGRPLPKGTWSVSLTVGTPAVHRTIPLAPRSWEHVLHGEQRERGSPRFLYRSGAGMLRLQVGRRSTAVHVAESIEARVLAFARRLARAAARSPLRAMVPAGLRGSATTMVARLGAD